MRFRRSWIQGLKGHLSMEALSVLEVTFVPKQGALVLQLLIMPLCPACVQCVTCLSPASSAKEGSLVQGSSHP